MQPIAAGLGVGKVCLREARSAACALASGRHQARGVLIHSPEAQRATHPREQMNPSPKAITNEVLEYIDEKHQELNNIPLFTFVQEPGIDPLYRLSFAPGLIPMALGFADLMKYGLMDPYATDRHQKILNEHANIDSGHWMLFLRDLQTLGFNQDIPLVSSVEFLWGSYTEPMRKVIYTLMALARNQSPMLRLATLEAVEVATAKAFSHFRVAGRHWTEKYGSKLFYFGQAHQDEEDQHEELQEDSIRSLIAAYS